MRFFWVGGNGQSDTVRLPEWCWHQKPPENRQSHPELQWIREVWRWRSGTRRASCTWWIRRINWDKRVRCFSRIRRPGIAGRWWKHRKGIQTRSPASASRGLWQIADVGRGDVKCAKKWRGYNTKKKKNQSIVVFVWTKWYCMNYACQPRTS